LAKEEKRMHKNQRLIFIAHPRSGSSSLFQILQLHPQLNLLEEPFNEGYSNWSPDGKTYLEKLVDLPAFIAVLDDIFSRYDGLKLLNYQLDAYMNTYLFQREDLLFIFMRRRNILQSVVSTMIADQTGLWKMWEMVKAKEDYFQKLQPLDILEIQRDVHDINQQLNEIEGQLDQRPAQTVVKFVYEDLYFSPPAEQRRQIDTIWPFLGLSALEDERIRYYLSPEKVKINSKETYRLVPNIQEIEDQCGSNQTGWLLR
jgi:hypothetical protein